MTSQKDQTRIADDEILLSRAATLGRLLFTYDDDFLAIAASRQRLGRTIPVSFLQRKWA